MPIFRIDDVTDPRVAEYCNVTDSELLQRQGLFVAEGRMVIRRLLTDSRCRTRTLLLTESALDGLRGVLEGRDDLPVYVAPLEAIKRIGGLNFHRGCLALGERPADLAVADLADSNGPVLVLEGVTNADNVGAAFRNGAAFAAAGVLLSPDCCDPLYRKAIRTSMGAALKLPFVRAARWPDALASLKAAGFSLVALTPDSDAIDIADEFAADPRRQRIALLLGSEGYGLTSVAQSLADRRVRVPIVPASDSINVATAAAIALHRLFRGGGTGSSSNALLESARNGMALHR